MFVSVVLILINIDPPHVSIKHAIPMTKDNETKKVVCVNVVGVASQVCRVSQCVCEFIRLFSLLDYFYQVIFLCQDLKD